MILRIGKIEICDLCERVPNRIFMVGGQNRGRRRLDIQTVFPDKTVLSCNEIYILVRHFYIEAVPGRVPFLVKVRSIASTGRPW